MSPKLSTESRSQKVSLKCTKMARDFLLVKSKEKRAAFDGRNFRGENSLTPELGIDPNCLRQTGLMTLATTYLSSTHTTRRRSRADFKL